MKKTTKGALAAGTAAVLLTGGAGTLAYWNDTQPITGSDINAGHLSLDTDVSNTGCGDWQLDSDEVAFVTYGDGDPLVPGDVLTKVCEFTISAVGNHLRATLDVSTPNMTDVSGTFGADLTTDVTNIEVAGSPLTEITEDNDGDTLTATIVVTFDSASTNGTQDVQSVLDDLTLTATQVHT